MTKPFFTSAQRHLSQHRPPGARISLALWLSLGCLLLSLLLIAGVIMGLSASYTNYHRPAALSSQPPEPIDFSQPAWALTVTDDWRRVRSLPSEPPKRNPYAPRLYDQAMAVGYKAYQKQDYQTALINFRRALADKAGDRYATEAIANTEAIIQKQRKGDQSSEDERSPQ